MRFIREHQNKPFFLYLAHMHVHLPIYAPERFLRESENGRYGAAVACIDWATGVLMQELKSLGQDEDTLIIFTSDNGSRCRDEGGSNGALRGTKGTTWEGGQRVPCIMRWPGKIPAGTVCGGLATAMDLFPTLAGLAGASIPQDRIIDGIDIKSLLVSGDAEPSPRETFFYYHGNKLEAVRQRSWKLHVRKGDEDIRELYDLAADPGETNNVCEDHPGITMQLLACLAVCREDLGDASHGIAGRNVRAIGEVAHPKPLTEYNPAHPYIEAMYDLKDRG